MVDAKAGAIAAIVINVIIVFALTISVIAYSSSLGSNFYPIIAGCVALILCVIPPTVATYTNLQGNSYSYENYILQVFLPMGLGFLLLLSIFFFDLLTDLDQYYEECIIYVGSASILSSALALTFLLQRMGNHGT